MLRADTFFNLIITLCVILALSTSVHAIELKHEHQVNAVVSVDSELKALIDSFPEELRRQFLEAAMKVMDRFDQSVVDAMYNSDIVVDGFFDRFDESMQENIRSLSKELRVTGTMMHRKARCLSDKFVEDAGDIIPMSSTKGVGWLGTGWFLDRCERSVKPDKTGLSYIEKFRVSDCRVSESLSTLRSTSIAIDKLSKLEQYAGETLCRLDDNESITRIMERNNHFVALQRAFSAVEPDCPNMEDCLSIYVQKTKDRLSNNIPVDVEPEEYVSKLLEIEDSQQNEDTLVNDTCLVDCLQDRMKAVLVLNESLSRRLSKRDEGNKKLATSTQQSIELKQKIDEYESSASGIVNLINSENTLRAIVTQGSIISTSLDQVDKTWSPLKTSTALIRAKTVRYINYAKQVSSKLRARIEAEERLKNACNSGLAVVPYSTTQEAYGRSRRCRVHKTYTWNAIDGHFFLNANALYSVIKENYLTFSKLTSRTPHPSDVLKDGKHQMLSSISVLAHADAGSSTKKKNCGHTVRLNLKQYPIACGKHVVQGFD